MSEDQSNERVFSEAEKIPDAMSNERVIFEIEKSIRAEFKKNGTEEFWPSQFVGSDPARIMTAMLTLESDKRLDSVIKVFEDSNVLWSGSSKEFEETQKNGKTWPRGATLQVSFRLNPVWKESLEIDAKEIKRDPKDEILDRLSQTAAMYGWVLDRTMTREALSRWFKWADDATSLNTEEDGA